MILNNFWLWQKNIQEHAGDGSLSRQSGFNDTSGTGRDVNFGALNNYVVNNYSLTKDAIATFGESTTEPSATDYSLANDITSDIGSVSITYAFESSGNVKRTIMISGTNTDTEAHTIRQVGIGKKMSAGGSDTKYDFLFAVCVLSNALTVPANSDFVITLEWTES